MGQLAPRAVTLDLATGEQRFTMHNITWEQYEAMRAATDLMALDIGHLLTFVRPDDQTGAVRAYRDALRV